MEMNKDDNIENEEEEEEDFGECVLNALPGEHHLQKGYTFWYMQRDATGRTSQAQDYEKSIKKIGTCCTVEGFWRIYDHLTKPNDIPTPTEYHVFREGIKPIWEDPANKNGGKLTIRLVKGLASRYWELVLMAIIGEAWNMSGEVCGAVISVRQTEDILGIWHKTADNQAILTKLQECLRTTLDAPSWAHIMYTRHEKRIPKNRRGSGGNSGKEATTGTSTTSSTAPPKAQAFTRPEAGKTSTTSSGWRLE